MVTPDEQKVCATEPKVWNIYSILTSLARSSIPSRPTGSGHQIGLIRRESIRRGGLSISVVSLTCRKVPPALSYISLRIRDISSMSMESGSLSGQRAAVRGSGTMTRSISHRISAVDGMWFASLWGGDMGWLYNLYYRPALCGPRGGGSIGRRPERTRYPSKQSSDRNGSWDWSGQAECFPRVTSARTYSPWED